MDDLPIEVIGDILSRLQSARYVVIASAVCRKWQEARKDYIHTLIFNIGDWDASYRADRASQLSIIVPQTLFQTSKLKCLSIFLKGVEFSADSVISWVMYSRNTLRELNYDLNTTPDINILQKCDLHKLEVLNIRCYSITWIEPNKKFPCLRSVSLTCGDMSPLNPSVMMAACPNIEFLTLITFDRIRINWDTKLLKCNSLKDIYFENIHLDDFMLEANNIENLHFYECSFNSFKLVGKNTLKYLKIEKVLIYSDFDIGDGVENLEVVDVDHCFFRFHWEKIHSMISRSSRLTSLLIWDVGQAYMDIKTICSCFPLLTHLSLSYDWRIAPLFYDNEHLIPATTTHGQGGGDSLQLENVVMLELGWWDINDDLYLFSPWVPVFLERCPNLKELIIYGKVSSYNKSVEKGRTLASFTSSIIRLMRKYLDVKLELQYK